MKHDKFILLEDARLPDFNDKYGDLAQEISNTFAIQEGTTQSFIENMIALFCIIMVNNLASRDTGNQPTEVLTKSIAVVVERVLARNIRAFAEYDIQINTGEKTDE